MPNLALTLDCNRACSYCFARAAAGGAGDAPRHLPRALFERALDLVVRSGVGQLRLLGGEPTLHPEFLSFLELGLARGLPLRLFSNGDISEVILRRLLELPPERVSLVVNLSASLADAARLGALTAVLARLGPRAMLGVNVSRPRGAFGPPGTADGVGYLLDLVDRCGLRRELRVGLAHPCVGLANEHLPPRAYAAAGLELTALARRAVARSVRLSLDCGFVPCMAPDLLDPALGIEPARLTGHCRPVLDVLPDGRVIPCYPLARVFAEALPLAADVRALRERVRQRTSGYRALGVLRECDGCALRASGACSGGCLAAALQRLRSPDFAITL